MSVHNTAVNDFINCWPSGNDEAREGFIFLKKTVDCFESAVIEFIQREGLTYSLRVKHTNQVDKPLFAMIDVIEGEPRWLSVCFYAEFITDLEEKGDFVPGGLLGEDAICFDVDSHNMTLLHYLQDRILEAHTAAAG